MKTRQFLEEKDDQLLNLGIDYLASFDLFPKIHQSRIKKSYVTNTATAILDYSEAKELLDKIEAYIDRHYFEKFGVQEKNGVIIFKFRADNALDDYSMNVQMTFQNRHADSRLIKGQYKFTVTFI
jgi:hypothetical protein